MTDTLAALGMALVLLFPGAALSQSPPDCATTAADVDRLSAQLSQASARSETHMADALAEQARHAAAVRRQRSAGAVADVVASAIGAVVPAAGQVGALVRAAAPVATRTPPAPDRAMLADVAAALVAQGDTAVRIGGLLDRLRARGCPGVTTVQP